jgi:hypothetical protein
VTPLLGALGARRPGVLAFIDLVQDVDVMLPVLQAIRADGTLRLKIAVSRWLSRESPRTEALLHEHGFDFTLVRRRDVVEGRSPSLRGMAAVISAAESSHPAHTAAHALARRARNAGLRAYALQHGFENLGLFGLEAAGALFASEVVFCWYPPTAVPDEVPGETRAKLVHAGRPDPLPSREKGHGFDVGVFENLHWERYSEADRLAFQEGFAAAAGALPRTRFLLRAHPAGGWADRFGHELARFGNITVAGAAEGRSRLESGADLVRGLGRVITTPSTVALDAAVAGRPVALASDGGPAYHPLPVLRTPQDWIEFASGAGGSRRTLDQFLSRVLVAGDGAPRIVARLSRDLRRFGRDKDA